MPLTQYIQTKAPVERVEYAVLHRELGLVQRRRGPAKLPERVVHQNDNSLLDLREAKQRNPNAS